MLILLALLPATLAQDYTGGDTPALNAQNFHPTIDGASTFGLDDSGIRDRTFTVRGLLHYAMDPLVYEASDGTITEIVSDVVQLDGTAGYGFGPVRLGLHVPIYLFTEGSGGSGAGLGDIALDGKVRFLDGTDAPVGLALDGRMALPTNTASAALGADGLQGDVALVIDRWMGDLYLGANLGVRFQPTTKLENTTWDDQLLVRLGGAYALSPEGGLSLELAGLSTFQDFGAAASSPVEGILGGWYRPEGGGLVVRAGAGTGLDSGIGAPRLRLLLAVAWEPSADRDRDGDGLVDGRDACPGDPEDRDAWEDDDGCPEPTPLTILVVDPSGQPVLGARVSLDGQALGSETRTAATAGTHQVDATLEGFEDAQVSFDVPAGPPVEQKVVIRPFARVKVVVLDTDGKPLEARISVLGEKGSQEAEAASVLEGMLPAGGVKVDVRREGFAPYVSTVALAAGQETLVEVRLAPSKAKLDQKAQRIEIGDSVYFDLDKDTIQSVSFALLDEVAQILQDHPELLRIRIEGHTDSRGSAAYNLDLSKRRAAAVRTYLVGKGVAPERLESEGYGESKPLVKGENEAAWSKNRRVDFFVVQRAD
ncbi:MAG: OmpA family protein [Deltaproteobacteria bacterium]|nr:OmpA family protein [Deltaproteobacteria bacterium]